MGFHIECFLLHTELRWLSKGKVLSRFTSLRTEMICFFDAENSGFEFLNDDNLWLEVVFLNDLFEKLDVLNLCLQGANENIITITGKLKSFIDKLELWIRKFKNSQPDCFPSVKAFQNRFEILSEVQKTVENLSVSFSKYFPSLDYQMYEWVINPFARYDSTLLPLTLTDENLIDMENDPVHKASFSVLELSEFWISLWSQYPRLTTTAVTSLFPFVSSYLRELGITALIEMK
uniref:Zinc finger BED domain-containing protein 5 n=1 Tax=Octopus bimaculoides TaxID=37653 RepID=A0A0L8FUQ5_OCTBM